MILLLLTTQNEADVLKLNLEHHLSYGVDHIVVCDNMSTDHTRDVIAQFKGGTTVVRFRDFRTRQHVRMAALEDLKRKWNVSWAGVADTDEFFWSPMGTMPELLAHAPRDVLAVTFHQKLYVPTALDAETGPVYERLLYRTGSYDSPLHTSYIQGKTFYRTSWLSRITHEHRCKEVPHPEWGPFPPAVHHYMIRDEDQFVDKVRRLKAWRPKSGWQKFNLYHIARDWLRLPTQLQIGDLKPLWWSIWIEQGEDGLRDYYRTRYRIQKSDIGRYLNSGDLVLDSAFSDWTRTVKQTETASVRLTGSQTPF